MLLKELAVLHEGMVADKYAELEDSASVYTPYMFIEAKPAETNDIGQFLPLIIAGPTTKGSKYVKKGDFIARILQTGSVKISNPMNTMYVISPKTFAMFTELKNRSPDIEGFQQYDTEGDIFNVVADGSEYIIKKGDNLTKISASLFTHKFRKQEK